MMDYKQLLTLTYFITSILEPICLQAIHTFSVERFSENFDKKAETCLIFFLEMH